MKYIFVTGGVVSGLGKGICAASLGRLLKQCGLRVRNQKFDPYLNVDPGTMSPYQHGEVFVTDDGAETDLDLGHYERFVDEALTGDSSVSSGKIFWSVLNRERQGGYLGGTVQIIPHVTDEIKRRLYAMDDGQTDVVIAEIGGTVGDIESQPYLEAIRQVAAEQGRENVLYIHVPLVVSIPGNGELKSKPTQHSVKELLSVGIQPDILVCRTDSPLPEDMRKKIALFCNVSEDCVIPNLTASTLYEVPLLLEREGLCRVVCRKLGLGVGEPDMRHWQELVTQIHAAEQRHVTIALVGKYTELHDAYLSVSERQSPDMDSDEYSMYHPGDDPSETFALREYLSGDRIKSIHWKLSEKTDHLMVRQLGLPVNNSILLVLDNSAGTVPSAAEREALGEAVVSVSAALCEAGLPHQAAWLDRETMEPRLCAIGSMEDLTQALSGLLSAETEPDEQTVTQRLAEEQGLDYAHVAALSLRPEEEELYTASGTPVAHLTVSEKVLKSKEGIYLAL